MSRILTIQPPLAGISQRTGFQNPPDFSAYDSTNFWPIDVDTGRLITSVRPAQAEVSSPGSTCNLLSPINGFATGKPTQSIVSAAAGTLFYRGEFAWFSASGAQAAAVDTGRAVYAQPFLQHSYIFVEDNPPIDFDYVTGLAKYGVATAGAFPEDCRFGMAWQGALWMAGSAEYPHILFGSRTGDAYDYEYIVDPQDEGGAWTSAGENEGLLNGPLTALIPHTTDSAIISTVEGLVALRGHPRRGGEQELVSSEYVLGQGAWCKLPGDVLFFMSPSGFMTLGPRAGEIATPLSDDKVPDELKGLTYDIQDPKIAMAYSSRWGVVYLTVRGAQAQSWLYDPRTNGFHRQSFDNYPYVMYEHKPFVSETTCGVLWGKS